MKSIEIPAVFLQKLDAIDGNSINWGFAKVSKHKKSRTRNGAAFFILSDLKKLLLTQKAPSRRLVRQPIAVFDPDTSNSRRH